ncbi:unnamed protein product [Sympodiomycopsis kandeliae]
MHMHSNTAFTVLSLGLLIASVAPSSNHHLQHHQRSRGRHHHDQALVERQSSSAASGKGRATYWDAGGGQGNCGQKHFGSEMIVAMNHVQWNINDCGKWVSITYNGTTDKGQIVDQCADCPWGALDLSPTLFAKFAPLQMGIFQMEWVMVGGGGGGGGHTKGQSSTTDQVKQVLSSDVRGLDIKAATADIRGLETKATTADIRGLDQKAKMADVRGLDTKAPYTANIRKLGKQTVNDNEQVSAVPRGQSGEEVHVDVSRREVQTQAADPASKRQTANLHGQGRASIWDPQGGLGNCGKRTYGTDMVVAMNGAQWNIKDCFKWLTITANGVTTNGQIVDQYGGCPNGGMDMSPSLFSKFYPLSKGIFDMSWTEAPGNGSSGGGHAHSSNGILSGGKVNKVRQQ